MERHVQAVMLTKMHTEGVSDSISHTNTDFFCDTITLQVCAARMAGLPGRTPI